MVHTLPDYSSKLRADTIFGVADMGELAARLGSVDAFDRRGNIIWIDDFEAATIGWEVQYTGGAGNTNLSTNRWLHGSQSLYIEPDTDDDDRVMIIRNLAYPVVGKLGLEATMTCVDEVDFLAIYMRLYDGTNYHDSGFGYWNTTEQLTYINSIGGNTTFANNIKTNDDDRLFLHFKYVYDFVNDKYVRGLFNGVEYNMSSYSGPLSADATHPYLRLYVVCDCDGTGTAYSYVDNVILTQNEV